MITYQSPVLLGHGLHVCKIKVMQHSV